MLTRAHIRSMTHASFYARGLDLYITNKVKELKIEESSFIDRVSARVKGSGTKVYNVGFIFDTAKENVRECQCDCPAFYSYDGLCKHLVAVLLKYADQTAENCPDNAVVSSRQMMLPIGEHTATSVKAVPHQSTDSSKVSGKGAWAAESGGIKAWSTGQQEMKSAHKRLADYFPEMTPPTTPAIKQLLERQLVKRTAPLMLDQVFGWVKLEPCLICKEGRAEVEFKLGTSHMYVLKDVFEFDRHFREGEEYRYGKQLKFVHLPEAFAPEYRSLVQFIRSWVRENARRYVQSVYYGYHTQVKLRSMPLTGNELEAFLDAAGELPIMVLTEKGDLGSCRQSEGAPERTMKITGENGGIRIEVKEPESFQGNRYRFYFTKGRIGREAMEDLKPIEDFLVCVGQLPGNSAYIQKEDMILFCRDLLPELEKYYICTRENFSEQDYNILPVSFEIYLDAPQEDMITCRVIAVYGERRYNVYGDKEDMGQRDLTREIPVGKAVSSYCNAYDEGSMAMVISGSEEMMYDFLTEGIPRLHDLGEVFISDSMKRMKVNSSPRISVGISLAGDLLELNMTSEDMSKEQLLEILNKYDRKKKYYRLKNGEFINVAGESLETLADLKQGLGLTDRQLIQEEILLPRYRAMFLDTRLREQETVQAVKDRAFRALVRNMKTVEDNDFEVPQILQPVLREYQKKGFLWLKTLQHNGFGGILADDMGLGKTLQVIAFLYSSYEPVFCKIGLESVMSDGMTEEGPASVEDAVENPAEDRAAMGNRRCLIITPASLVYNWYSEIQRFAPGLPTVMVLGNAVQREEIIKRSSEQEVLITSYDLLKRDIGHYEKLKFFCQVIDEAQFIKNNNTQVTKAVKKIQASCRLALTGTPVENRLSELWSIFDYLMPGFLFGYQRFREEFEGPIVQQKDETAMERLKKMIKPFVLRRLKKDVLKDLPDKLEETMYTRMEGEQQSLYDAHVKRLALMLDKQTDEEFKSGKIQILSELTKLRQLCCDPSLLYEDYQEGSAKANMCLDLISNALSGGHKILLFSQFTSMLEILCQRLTERGISFYILTGATSKEKRRELVESFNQDATSVFCISLKAGGTGLNLAAADIVIHYDPWWNLAVQNQATDRAHRIGQKNAVTVYKLVTKGTIEENIIKLQDKKRELADRVLGGEGVGSGSFTREELKEIIGYGAQ